MSSLMRPATQSLRARAIVFFGTLAQRFAQRAPQLVFIRSTGSDPNRVRKGDRPPAAGPKRSGGRL